MDRDRERLVRILYEEKRIPDFNIEIKKISYSDGVKIYFEKVGWIIVRFSGTEPLLRVFCEMDTEEGAARVSRKMKEFLKL